MKATKLFIAVAFLFSGFISQAQQYSFIPDSLRLLSMQELSVKGPPASLDLVYYEDGTKTTLQEVLPKIGQGKLTPQMFVDSKGDYTALVVVEAKEVTFEDLAENTEYDFVPEGLRLLPEGQLFQKPAPQSMEMVFYEDGTKTTLQEVIQLFKQQKASPKMFVNEHMQYKALVAVRK